MDKTLAAERLRALASSDQGRPKAARLRDVIDHVEAALAAGVPRVRVLDELKGLGLNMSLATFETTLRRIRGKHRSASAAGFPRSEGERRHASLVAPPSPAPPTAAALHRPGDLDEIMGSTPDLAALAKFAKRRKPQ